MLQETVTQTFETKFGAAPDFVVRAPGRVNLIGEHTDYNDGFVLPMAIDRAIWIALRARADQQVSLYSIDFGETAVFSLDGLSRGTGWAEYVKGVAWALQEAGHALRGWEGVMAGNVPKGAGLSSSAALELATARAFTAVSPIAWDAPGMARLSQRAENEWVGMNCGIMDQMISASGRRGNALLIDCRTLETELVPLPPGKLAVVLDTNTRRGLVDSAYNERRHQCEEAAAFFSVPALRDVGQAEFEARAPELPALTRRRARHVITENARTLEAAAAMRAGDAVRLGQLMNASHDSLRDDFEVSSDALNAMVDCARRHPACYGARMTGAGFGGCAVALVDAAQVTSFVQFVSECYEGETAVAPAVYVSHASDGAAVVATASGAA